jgi:hypothetical protein
MFEFIRENVNESIREGNMPSEPTEENFMTMEMPAEEVETEEEATI